LKICKDNAKSEYRKKVLENRKNLIPEMLEIKQLKAKLKEPAIRKRISNSLLFLAILMTVITTCTTIAGGINTHLSSLLTLLTFIFFVSFAQATILIISCLKPYLAKKASRYLSISSIMQVFLLIVSISFNFIFLYSSNNSWYIVLLNLILCVIFDVVILLLCEISFVIRLNIEFKNSDNRLKEIINIFSDKSYQKILKKLGDSVPDRLSKNPVQINSTEIKQIEKPVPDRVTNEEIKQDIKKIIMEQNNLNN
jgi:FlaA1/EpsC-like NDP-sugar epimerase